MNSPIWFLATGDGHVAALLEVARGLGGPVVAVVVADDLVAELLAAAGVDRVLHLQPGDGVPAEAVAAHVGRLAAAEAPRVVLAGSGPADRVLLAAAAVALGAPVLTGVSTVSIVDASVVVERTTLGGIVAERAEFAGPVAVLLDGGGIPTPMLARAPVQVQVVTPEPVAGLTVLGTETVTVAPVELGAAPRVVGIGRGLRAREDLSLVEALAEAAGAELACSRPLAEEHDWLAKERYIGISGQHVAPDLYVAIGISGQLQHMAGVRGAPTIVAINSDENAPIFAEADYGIVGDLYTVVPALTAALAGSV